MSRRHFIITGTSRGIGEQLAKLLLEAGYGVHGIARGHSEALIEYPHYRHINLDLSQVGDIEPALIGIFEQVDMSGLDMLCLINNAAMLEPLKSIELCLPDEIQQHIQVSLVAPMVLTSCFIRHTEGIHTCRKIINISSGSGKYPAPDMSVYSAGKAGVDMFTQCVGIEQGNRLRPIEIIAVDPGMADTEMQRIARSKPGFEMSQFFQEAYDNGQLQSTEMLGQHILNIIERNYESGKLVQVR
ncbi:short-chain dehydrogenase [Paenibacillus selenitireducens]|uniref:Short-chain dehydrogenase n=1 Tax=Paenibacillus selenitireducens TaxID=1324314 RepID=A0A1T2XN24_9BACL|nr:SDR family NAD(P)-dependent oxidoreductase [Paenibacillus selenitireducens]OPA81218.1 short-chain dehydrogenase [Paenibacillus selenitireducens]